MAPLAAKKNSSARGTALVEALPALACVMAFVVAMLLGAYLLFARAWINYQAEQALYCLAEGKPPPQCRAHVRRRLQSVLPYGELGDVSFFSGGEVWRAHLSWKVKTWKIQVRKELSVRRILKSRDLRW